MATCKDREYRDALLINQHRRCAFGGSYGTGDAWGSKGLGPVGEGVEQVNESCGVTLE